MSWRPLHDKTVAFRRQVIDALVTDGAAGYLTPDRYTGRCPLCGGDLIFRFHGRRQLVSITCLDACEESEIGAAIDLEEAS